MTFCAGRYDFLLSDIYKKIIGELLWLILPEFVSNVFFSFVYTLFLLTFMYNNIIQKSGYQKCDLGRNLSTFKCSLLKELKRTSLF